MTVIAYRDGVLAADSRAVVNSDDGGLRHFGGSTKLFRKAGAVIATAGESAPGLVFVDWYGSGKKAPERLVTGDADFVCIVLTKDGLFEYDKWCRGEKLEQPFYAIGCGAKAALGAMHMGASAEQACVVACRIDAYCAEPIVTMTLEPSDG
jgi:hypothetical protein